MAAYATTTDFEEYVEGWVTDDAAALTRLLERATRDVDNVLGPLWPLEDGAYAGLKLDPTTLTDAELGALVRATCAQAWHRFLRGDELDRVAGGLKRVKGPDYEIEYGDAAQGVSGLYSPRLPLELGPIRHLRPQGARIR